MIKRLVLVLTVGVLLAGCGDLFKKKSKSKSPPQPKYIVLPNGQRVSLIEKPRSGAAGWEQDTKTRAMQCVESICSLPQANVYKTDDRYFTLTVAESARLPEAERKFEIEIWPKLDQVINVINEDSTFSEGDSEIIKKRTPADRPLRVDPITINFIKFGWSMKNLSEFTWEDHYDQNLFLKTKKLALKKSVVDQLTPEKRKVVESALVLFSRYLTDIQLGSGLSYIESVGLRFYLLQRYDKTDLEKSRAEFVKNLKEQTELLKRHSPVFYKSLSKNLVLQKAIDGKELLSVEEADLGSTLQSLYLFTSLINNTWPELDQIQLNLDDTLNGRRVIELIQDYQTDLIGPEAQKRHERSRKKAYEICKAGISAHFASRPERSEIQNTEQRIKKIKQASKVVAAQIYNSVNAADINSIIDNTNFTLPSAADKTQSEILKSVDALKEIQSQDGIDNLNELSDSEFENLLGVFVAFQDFSDSKSEKEDDEYSDLTDFCMRYLPKGLSDHFLTIENRIVISESTIKAGEGGVGVIAHEIGHRLFGEMNDSTVSSVHQCLKDRHTSIEKDPDAFLEEDFADHFSGKVLKALGLTESKYNFACMFFNRVWYPQRGQFLPAYYDGTTHPLVSVGDDDHSSSTFRLIQTAQDLGHSTPTCQSFTQSEAGKAYMDDSQKPILTPAVSQCGTND